MLLVEVKVVAGEEVAGLATVEGVEHLLVAGAIRELDDLLVVRGVRGLEAVELG
jgi:hypothetical protein